MSRSMKLTKLKMGLLSIISLLFLYSCEVENLQPATPTPETEETITDTVSTEKPKEEASKGDQNAIIIGSGSGTLQIKDVGDKNYTIKPGTYSSIQISNIKNTKVNGLGAVKVAGGSVSISNVNGLTLAGLSFENSSQSVINIYDAANNLTLKDLKFKNITNFVINFKINKKYNGTPESYSENIHLVNIHAENISSLFGTSGDIKTDGFYGLIKGFKLTGSSIINSPQLSNGIYLGVAENYEISNNIVNNVNASEAYPNGNNNHNGIFHVKGNGKIFGNKITNHQGNGVRAWLFSISKPNQVVEIYNNKVYNSTRYSAFEVQVTPSIAKYQSFIPADAKVYNNTVGRLNTADPKYYEGRVIDIYSTYGTVEVYNNLYFDMRDNLVSLNQSNPETSVKETNNQYFKSSNDAVLDLTNFKSKISSIGAY